MKAPSNLKPLDLFSSEGRNPDNFLGILQVVGKHGPMIKNEVAKALRKREGDISKRIDWLVEFGFLEVAQHRTKKSRFRTIKLKEYRPTLKGVFAISHLKDFDPIGTLGFYPEIPEIVRDLISSFGSERLRLYVNRVANEVKESVDETPPFERIESSDEALFGPLLKFGLGELSALIGSQGLDAKTQAAMEKVLLAYSDRIIEWIDTSSEQLSTQINGLKTFKQLLVEARTDPSRIRLLFQNDSNKTK